MTISDLVSSLEGYLSVTVAAAVILFITREQLEFRRRKAERTRKTKAIKLLLAEELEKNHWGSTPFSRTVALRVGPPVAAIRAFGVVGDCDSARYSQRYPLSPRLLSGSGVDAPALV